MAHRALSFYSSHSSREVRFWVLRLMAAGSLLLVALDVVAQETVGAVAGLEDLQSSNAHGVYQVTISEPVVDLVPLIEVKRKCGATLARYACTLFDRSQLLAQCRPVESGWVIDSSVRLDPVMVVSRPSYLGHELFHQQDLQEFLGKHLSKLSGERFAQRSDCLRAAGRAIGLFPSDFNHMKGMSNERRDFKVVAKNR